eukprot:8808731-Pyramimonas_sp.AAC.1
MAAPTMWSSIWLSSGIGVLALGRRCLHCPWCLLSENPWWWMGPSTTLRSTAVSRTNERKRCAAVLAETCRRLVLRATATAALDLRNAVSACASSVAPPV